MEREQLLRINLIVNYFSYQNLCLASGLVWIIHILLQFSGKISFISNLPRMNRVCFIQASPPDARLNLLLQRSRSSPPTGQLLTRLTETVSNTSHTESPSARGICNTLHLNMLRYYLDKMKIRERGESGERRVSDDRLCLATSIYHKLSSLASSHRLILTSSLVGVVITIFS